MMNKKTLATTFFLLITFLIPVLAQKDSNFRLVKKREISENALNELPADLNKEILLVLKFDSVNVPAKRPKGQSKEEYLKWRNHNTMVPRLNRELREAIKGYPFRYRIVPMSKYSYISNYDAKYLLWINSFDAYTDGKIYQSSVDWSGHGENRTAVFYGSGTLFGIIDLNTDKSYLISKNVAVSQTVNYPRLIQWLMNDVKRQFNIKKEK